MKIFGTAEVSGSGNSLQNKFLSGFWRRVLLDFMPGKSETFQIPARILQEQETWFLGLALPRTSPVALGRSLPSAHAVTACAACFQCGIFCSPLRGHLAQPRNLRPSIY